MHRRSVLATLTAVSAGTVLPVRSHPTGAYADAARPLRWIVPFPPGGTSDLRVRQVAERMKADAGWHISVENRAGASGMIGSDLVAKSAADGYKLLLGTIGTLAINPSVQASQPYDVLRDLQPITQFSRSVSVLLAHRDTGIVSVAALESRIKNGAKLAYASTGNASIGHMVGESYKRRSGLEITHIPYAGTAPAVRDFIGGQVPLLIETPSAVWPHLQSGTAVALAVTSAARMPQMPQAPTFHELGYRDFVFDTWQGALTRRGVAPEVLAHLHSRITQALHHPDVVRSHEEQVNIVVANTPAEFERTIAAETLRWARVVADTGVKVS